MLVVSRKKLESILIGDRIRVTVVSIRGGQCRIGIDAPIDEKILREDVADDEQIAAVDRALAVDRGRREARP